MHVLLEAMPGVMWWIGGLGSVVGFVLTYLLKLYIDSEKDKRERMQGDIDDLQRQIEDLEKEVRKTNDKINEVNLKILNDIHMIGLKIADVKNQLSK